MEELTRFEVSTFNTFSRRQLVEDRDTILELTGQIQELQNELYCMNDSRDFQDAESVRSGQSHVTSQPEFIPPFQDPGGMLSRSLGMPSRKNGPVIISTLSSRIESVEFIDRGAAPFIHSGKEWEANTRSRSVMPVWTVSRKFCHLQWRRLFKELWGRPTTTADFGSSFRQIPYTCDVCLLEDKIQDRGMYLFAISYGGYAVDQRSGDGWISAWSDIFAFYKGIFRSRLWGPRRENCFSTEQNHPEYPLQEKGQSGGTKGPKTGPFPSRKTDRSPDLRLLPGHWSQWVCREFCRPIYNCSSKWWYSGIRFEMGRNSIINDENPIWWHLGRIVQIQNTRVRETQDRIGIVWPGGSPEESWTWLSQIDDKWWKEVSSRIYELRISRPETEIIKGTSWSRIRGQNRVDKGLQEIVGNGKPTGSVLK